MKSARLYQLGCLLAALAILVGVAGPLQSRLTSARSVAMPAETAADSAELDSFAMSLLLGGFRGPLVMYLWVTSEDEKTNEDTEKILTRATLIGELQPQFKTIYVNQSWNLAYNVSVQYNRESEKYRWITKGIEFIERGERRLPNNTDVLAQAGHLYFDKLGQSFENGYYRRRFRQESFSRLLDANRRLRDSANPDDRVGRAPSATWRYIDRLDGVLAQVNRPDGKRPLPARPPTDADLREIGMSPEAARHVWPFGLSAYAIAYDYYKQASLTGPHSQFGASVMSSRPAMACREWLKEELDLAVTAESRLWPLNQSGQPLPVPSADLSPEDPALVEAVYHYQEAQRVAALARANYEAHLAAYRGEADIYVPHFNDVALRLAMAEASTRRLTGIGDWLRAKKSGDATALRTAALKLGEAKAGYAGAEQLIRDYMSTEYRIDPNDLDRLADRAPYELLANQAQRAADQIGRMLK